LAFNVIFRPTTDEAAPNRLRQNPSDNSTTRWRPARLFVAREVAAEHRLDAQHIEEPGGDREGAHTRSGSASPLMLTEPGSTAAIAENARFSRRQS
jgi:hypothetical protein